MQDVVVNEIARQMYYSLADRKMDYLRTAAYITTGVIKFSLTK